MDLLALKNTLQKYGQEHLLRFEGELTAAERATLYQEVASLDFDRLIQLHRESKDPAVEIDPEAVEPIDVAALPRTDKEKADAGKAEQIGMEALRAGRVAAVLVAGGQGSRLGFERPKGMFPIGPVSQSPLFRIHAEKILAWGRRAGRPIPWFILTSPDNQKDTQDFFEENHYFGLSADQVRFFVQGVMPVVDLETGKVLLGEKGRLLTSPNGHGGTLTALSDSGILDELTSRGVDVLYYFQVDNPFAKVLEPEFLGRHLASRADVSLKVIRKEHPDEKLGLVVRYQGKAQMIEYSDLPADLARRTDEHGELLLWTGSIAIHVFSVPFLKRVTSKQFGLPVHFARKAVSSIDDAGALKTSPKPNGLKFEMFIFDVLPMAERTTVVETGRADEYEPVKNATGEHSPQVVRKAISRRAAQWLRQAGVEVPTDSTGEPNFELEISPLAGLDADEFAAKHRSIGPIDGPRFFAD